MKNNNKDDMKKKMKKDSEQKAEKINNTTINKNSIILLIILLAIVIYIIYAIFLLIEQPTNIVTVEEGKLYQEETTIGYIIRDEVVVKGENYKNGMEQIKTEGERASVNENVFRYYSMNEESLKEKIAEMDSKIQEAMKNTNNILPSDMKLLEEQIIEKLADISVVTDANKLAEYKKEIDKLVLKKARIAGEVSPAGSYLKQLIDERKQYENQLNSGAEYVKAPMSGIVSYRVDGLEDILTPQSFDSLNKEYLEDLELKTGKMVATSEERGKLINNFECYIATIISSENAKNANEGDNIKIRLSNNEEISAKIIKIKEENDEKLMILKVTEQIKELINYRKITLDIIWWSSTGLKVPNQAIIKENEFNYVVRNRAGYLSKLLVKVTKIGDKYSIVEAYSNDELKELGYTTEEILNYKKISLYDEILIEPKIEEVQ
ncbi:MAG: hypothetical protein HUJ68_03055 [Clostridia bacterium]|nr:hypothetical protein [Clostridia bacterium]